MGLTQEQLSTARDYIQQQIQEGREWHTLSPCSAFAADVWNSVSANKLSDRNSIGISAPSILANSIQTLNSSH